MNNRLTALFKQKKERILNVYCTAGYPEKESMSEVIAFLQKNGADIIEIGMPYSDPVADGPVIQKSNMQALENGMTVPLLFEQLLKIKSTIAVPVILMGYLNPVLQYGIEKFCEAAASAGVSAVIIPDLPMYEYEKEYKKLFEQHGLSFIFLITPQTSAERIKQADRLSSGFLYAVSSSSVTGSGNNTDKKAQAVYYKRIAAMRLKNPLLIGFGINNKVSYDTACSFAAGAITGSAYIKALEGNVDIDKATAEFIGVLKGGNI